MDYFTGGPPRQLVAHGQSNPQGPQPASESPMAARTAITARRRTIRNPFPSPVYTGNLRKSRTGSAVIPDSPKG
jgi:hypothetical protein